MLHGFRLVYMYYHCYQMITQPRPKAPQGCGWPLSTHDISIKVLTGGAP